MDEDRIRPVVRVCTYAFVSKVRCAARRHVSDCYE